jgi:hypothetical protein
VQEYFKDLYRLRQQSEWSYSSVHALAAEVCLLLRNDLFCYDLDMSGSDSVNPNRSALADTSASGLRAEKDGADEQSNNN